jgi:hypothetical protein
MTTITVGTHRPQHATVWIVAISAAVLVAGLVIGLVFAFTGNSGGGSGPATGSVVETGQSGSGGTNHCPGSVKDRTC